MNRAGNPEPTPSETPPVSIPPASSKRRGVIPSILLVASLGLALYLGLNVIGVLYGIIFPPTPPVPADTQLTNHTSDAYGVDEWEYSTKQDACSLTRYYIEQGANCIFAPDICEEGFVNLSEVGPGQNVSRCTAQESFSIFAMQWNAIIATGYRDDYPTHYQLSREIFWTGEVPPPMFTPEPSPTPLS